MVRVKWRRKAHSNCYNGSIRNGETLPTVCLSAWELTHSLFIDVGAEPTSISACVYNVVVMSQHKPEPDGEDGSHADELEERVDDCLDGDVADADDVVDAFLSS